MWNVMGSQWKMCNRFSFMAFLIDTRYVQCGAWFSAELGRLWKQ
jgi:hypothetical protein